MRRALVTAVLGGALAVGGMGMTAHAAEAAPSSKVSASETTAQILASWHFYRAYWTLGACAAEGNALGGTYKCEYKRGSDGRLKWFLYRWY
ncbi:hypothetical protein JOF56_007871 [Kibdelosporangium banguiense]|uniref:Uncharacterized protein n=1 Tax=Kibdelosporangium banguiense TaxID=1365924 RepID=A0ABS4TSU8_9PSEU|nr:hypothetical protein [Kibdelosporangium banguiense]MBP2327486.1 hypothetical protein [Kibdelosporangium banguiense]